MKQYTNQEDLDLFRKAGRIAACAREHGLTLIKPGVSHLEVSLAVEEEIVRLGGKPAFPAQISLNHVAAHYCACPGDRLCFQEGDVAKLDVGVEVNGYVGDTAATVNLGQDDRLIQASRNALLAAIESIRPGMPIGEVGKVIADEITALGFRPVSNLTGHAVGIYQVHGEPQIPNVPERIGHKFKIGQVLAIEPFATTGRGVVRERGQPEIFSVKGRLKTKRGMNEKVVDAVAAFQGLPFARRNLADQFEQDDYLPTLSMMLRKGQLHAYPPLCEDEGIYISQAEHTVLIGEKAEILTRSD